MAVVWVMAGAPFLTNRCGDGEVRGELHGRMGSLRDLGMYLWWRWVMQDVKGEVSGVPFGFRVRGFRGRSKDADTCPFNLLLFTDYIWDPHFR